MSRAHYLNFILGSNPNGTCIGGAPAEAPIDWPWGEVDEGVMGFSVQIAEADFPFRLPGIRFIQLYQSVEEGDDPTPEVVVIREGDATRDGGCVLLQPRLRVHRAVLKVKEDPDVMVDCAEDGDSGRFFLSKLGGVDPWDSEEEQRLFLGQLHESSAALDFGGCDCGIYMRSDGSVEVVLR